MKLKCICRKKFFLFGLLLILFSHSVVAQANTDKKGTAELQGVVADYNLKTPLEFATVSVYTFPDSVFIKGTITNKKGIFVLNELPAATYFIKVEYLGYGTFTGNEFVLKDKEKQKLKEPVYLQIDTKTISEVKVKGNRDFERVELNKTVYNVSNSPVANGGTISEVLATIPRLDVNPEGDIKLRGSSNVKVLIDGKISGLLGMSPGEILRNMPAADIDRVEVITGGSAKYDASGTAGIINIILKKERAKGFNGNTSATIGTKDKHAANLGLNFRTGKINLFGTYSYRNEWKGRDLYTDRTINQQDRFIIDRDEEFGNRNQIGKLGMDYLINDKNTFSLAATNRMIKQNQNSTNFYEKTDLLSSMLPEKNRRQSSIDRDLTSWVYNASYIRKFDKKGQELSVDIAYTDNNADNVGNYEDFNSSGSTGNSNDFFKSARDEAVAQIDYIHPLGKSGKLETGYMYRTNEIDYKQVSSPQEDFNYKESIQGLYLQYSNNAGKWEYQMGLRTEYSDIETSRNYKDDYLDLFPNINLSYAISDNKQIALGYSKMVYRPDSRMLSPFQNNFDPKNQSLGNQKLRAYYTHQPELSFFYKRDKATYSSKLFYQYYDNIIQSLRSVESNGDAIVSYANLNSYHYAGLELTASNKLNKWWQLMTYLYGVYEKYEPKEGVNFTTNDRYFFSGKLVSNMKIPKWFTFQTAVRYQTDVTVAQGRYDDLYYVDLSFSKQLWKGRGNLSLSIYDIFDTKKFKVHTSDDQFYQKVKYNHETRIGYLTFRYYFGKKYRILKAKKKGAGMRHSELSI